MKVDTVNVVEMVSDTLTSVKSFSDDPEGNKEAEDCFKAIITENGDDVTEEEMADFITEGYFEQGDFQVFLAHSV